MLDLLDQELVQEKLELVEEQIGECSIIAKSGSKSFDSLLDVARNGGDVAAEGKKFANEYREKLENVLLPHQIKQLMRFEFQLRLGEDVAGFGLLSKLIIEKLGITAAQKNKLEEIDAELKAQMKEEFERYQERVKKAKAEHRKKMMAELTDEQRTIFEDVVGQVFEAKPKKRQDN